MRAIFPQKIRLRNRLAGRAFFSSSSSSSSLWANSAIKIRQLHYKVFRNNLKACNLKWNFIMIQLSCNYNLIILYILNRWQDSSLSLPHYNTVRVLVIYGRCEGTNFDLKLSAIL